MVMKRIWWFSLLFFLLGTSTPVLGQKDSIPTSTKFKGVVSGVVDFFMAMILTCLKARQDCHFFVTITDTISLRSIWA